jgi:hypothetical protein
MRPQESVDGLHKPEVVFGMEQLKAGLLLHEGCHLWGVNEKAVVEEGQEDRGKTFLEGFKG